MSENRQIDLDSGTIVFGDKRTDKSFKMDLLLVQLVVEAAESKHRLEAKEGRLHPTAPFLIDLASEFRVLGFEDCTPTQAFEIWSAASIEFQSLKKNIVQTLKSAIGSTATPDQSAANGESVTTPTSDQSAPSPESITT